jgi:hydroxymethylpyrimidine/phosphomethylpyrimidine kinase
MTTQRLYKVLTIAGFDGSGGAGIQADLKTFSALGCYGTTALTALPIQNTIGVRSVYGLTAACVKEQIEAILEDISLDAIKIGMLHRQEIIEAVALSLLPVKGIPVVLDPVMVAKSGDALLLPDAITTMQTLLFPLVTVLTPNLLEASKLLGRKISTPKEMEEGAMALLKMGTQAIVVKGGHLQGDCSDCLVVRNGNLDIHWFTEPRIVTKNTHGTGCTFSAAITAFLARGWSIPDAVKEAKHYLTQAIQAGAGIKIGGGNGPVHHFHQLWSNQAQPKYCGRFLKS